MNLFKYNKDKQQEFSIGSVFKLIKIHKLFVILFVLVTLLIITIYSFIIPEQYQSTTTIIPPEEIGTSGGGLTAFLQSLSGGVNFSNLGQGNKIQMFQEFLQSHEVAKIIADTLNLKNDPKFRKMNDEAICNVVASMLDVFIKRTGLIVLTAYSSTGYFPSKTEKSEAAKFCSQVANAAVEALDKLNKTKNTSLSHRKKLYIEKVLALKQTELNSADSSLENFRKSNKVLAIDEQSQAVLTNAISIGSELAKSEVDLNLKLLEYEPKSPIIRLYKEKINNLKSQFQKIQSGGIGNGDEFSIPLSNVPLLMRQYTNLIRNQKVLEQVNLYLETQKYQESIQEESDIPTVEVLDRAVIPPHRSSPNRKLMLLMAFLLSSFASIAFVIGYALYKGNLMVPKAYDGKSNPTSDIINS